MIEGSQLEEVGIAGFGVATMQILGELQHIVGVTALRTVDILHKVLTSLATGEVLTTTVAAKGQCALACYDIPEVGACSVVSLVATQLGYTLKTYHLGHLGVGMHVVEHVATLHQRVQQAAMRESAGHIQIFLLASDGVGIGQHLVHATMLGIQRALHLSIGEIGCQVDGPVAEAQKELLGLLVATINPRVAKAGIHLVYIIERNPRAKVGAEVSFLKVAPDTVAAGHTAHIATAPVGVVLGIGIGTGLQLANPVFHALAALLAASSSIDGHRSQIVAAHVSVQSVPIRV